MPAKYSHYPTQKHNAKKLWEKKSKGQGFGSLYGGNQASSITKDVNVKTINEDIASSFPE